MPGWESLVRITPSVAWGNPGALARRGHFLYADNINLDMGAQVAERDQKMLGLRENPASVFSIDRYYPKGNFTFQPRVDDILMILMAHFQCVMKANGTYTFFRIPYSPSFDTLPTGTGTYNVGSSGTFGTGVAGSNVYSINVDNYYGASAAPGTGANGARFTNGIVEKLTFNQRFGEDLSLDVECKFYAGSWYSYGSVFAPLSAYGSLSEFSRYVDYHGTISVGGESFELTAWQGAFTNNSSDRGKIGKRGYQRYPFAGHWMADGSFDMELYRDLNVLMEGSSVALISDFCVGTNRLYINQPKAIYRPFTVNIPGGEGIIEISKGYRAYPPTGTNLALGSFGYVDMPSTFVSVCVGTEFSSSLLGF